jgi:hypothetical protein
LYLLIQSDRLYARNPDEKERGKKQRLPPPAATDRPPVKVRKERRRKRRHNLSPEELEKVRKADRLRWKALKKSRSEKYQNSLHRMRQWRGVQEERAKQQREKQEAADAAWMDYKKYQASSENEMLRKFTEERPDILQLTPPPQPSMDTRNHGFS